MKHGIVGKKGSMPITMLENKEENVPTEIIEGVIPPEIRSCRINNLTKKKSRKRLALRFRLRRILHPKVFNINTEITEKGLSIYLRKSGTETRYNINFPEEIWKSFPENSRLMLRDNLALLSSLELGLMFDIKKINYDTPLPVFKSFFMELLLKCLLYSGDCDYGQTLDYITRLCNLEFVFKGTNSTLGNFETATQEQSINTLTFGKESLLGFGLCRELGLNPIPITIIEPDLNVIFNKEKIRSFENKHKRALMKLFEKEFEVKVYEVDNGMGEVRCHANLGLEETDLGWSTQLTQYLFFLLPFSSFYKAKYLVFGNESSCDDYYYSKDGLKCYPSYDQTSEWFGHMNAMVHSLSQSSLSATSIVQPLQEIAVAKILYQRYPELAKYQMSCHADNEGAKDNRWCNQCSKCARCFIFMKALGFDPASVGLKEMLTLQHKNLYSLFNQSKNMRGFDSVGLGRDEQLFAFQLAAKKGIQGELIDLFKMEFGEEAASKEEELKNDFFKLHRPTNIPPGLWKKLKPIFEEELKK